jgi:hypothetical protein
VAARAYAPIVLKMRMYTVCASLLYNRWCSGAHSIVPTSW